MVDEPSEKGTTPLWIINATYLRNRLKMFDGHSRNEKKGKGTSLFTTKKRIPREDYGSAITGARTGGYGGLLVKVGGQIAGVQRRGGKLRSKSMLSKRGKQGERPGREPKNWEWWYRIEPGGGVREEATLGWSKSKSWGGEGKRVLSKNARRDATSPDD